jgi:hypothetical protein
MSHAVRDTRTIEWTVAATNGNRTAKETQQDSRVVFITEGLPQEMKSANCGRPTVFRPDVLTMRWVYPRHGGRNNWQWELRNIYLTGPRILTNGEAGYGVAPGGRRGQRFSQRPLSGPSIPWRSHV